MATGTNAGGVHVGVELEEGGLDASLARIRQSLTVVGEQIRALNVQFAGGGMSVETYTKKLDELNQRNDILKRSSKDLETQIRATNAALAAGGVSQLAVGISGAGDAMNKTGINAAFLTRGVVDLSRGLEDFATGGFLGILNNLPGIVMNFSMAFGVAAEKALAFGTAVSIIATGAYALYKNWGLVQSVLGTGLDIPALKGLEALEDRLKTLNKRIEELRGQGKLSLPELHELNKATEERSRLRGQIADEKTFQRVVDAPRPDEEARGKAFADAAQKIGGRTALGQLELYLEQQANDKGQVGVLGADVGTPAQVARQLMIEGSRGNEAAIGSIMKVLPNSSAFRDAIQEGSPETKARREAEDKFESEGHKRAMEDQKRRDDYRESMLEGSKAEAEENDANWQKQMERKIKQREALTPGELEALPAEMKDKLNEQTRRDREKGAGLDERASDLNWRRMQLLNPQRENQRMGLDQFDVSVHGRTGMTEEARLLHDLNEIQKEHLKIAREKQRLGGVARK